MGTIGREAVDWGILITVVCGSETLGGGGAVDGGTVWHGRKTCEAARMDDCSDSWCLLLLNTSSF